ncbi:hypothetical protein RND81_09G170300 [Saponaria officinalis]|uniref:Uncharacterized protein n=1 Tax=Saponaria officinalis TaxID=3572 RepID=A0AAW1IN45_SAPOF
MAKMKLNILFILVFVLLSPSFLPSSGFVAGARRLGTNSERVYVVGGQQSGFTDKVLDDCLPKSRFRRGSAPSRYVNEETLGATLCSNARVVAPSSTP